jgi:hypothetical protein
MEAKLKFTAKPYCHKTWERGYFKQFCPIPNLTFCYNPYGWFIEHGVHTGLFVIGFTFLIWDFGIMFYKDMVIIDK